MKSIVITWEEEYKIFEPGDVVRAKSRRSGLSEDDRRYTVTGCHIPQYAGDESIVYLDGVKYGESATYIGMAEDVEASRRKWVADGFKPDPWWEEASYAAT
jgi:hypothetical protein